MRARTLYSSANLTAVSTHAHYRMIGMTASAPGGMVGSGERTNEAERILPVKPADWYFPDNSSVQASQGRALKDSRADETTSDEFVRQWILRELTGTYGYPQEWLGGRIVIDEPVGTGSSCIYASIAVKNSSHDVFLYIETCGASGSRHGFDSAREHLEAILTLSHTATTGMVSDGRMTQVLERNRDLRDCILLADIPAYELNKTRYMPMPTGESPCGDSGMERCTGLKPLTEKLENILADCHGIIRDIDGLHDDEALDELCKVIFAKIFHERQVSYLPGRIFNRFHVYGTGSIEEGASHIRSLYEEARISAPCTSSLNASSAESPRGVFSGLLRLSSRSLYRCTEKLQDYSFSDTRDMDIKGRAFQKVLGTAARAGMGQFFTPHEVVDLVVKMVRPAPPDLILDPFCGSGYFLAECREYVEARHRGHVDDDTVEAFASGRLHGIEKSERMARIALTDLMLRGDGHTIIRNTDAFLGFHNYPDLLSLGGEENDNPAVFSKILTNPPFGSIVWGEDVDVPGMFRIGLNRKSLPLEYLAIERCLQFLKPGGLLAIVVPDGIVTNAKAQFARTWVMSQARILAVISLPLETFAPFGTQTKTSILFLQKHGEEEMPDCTLPVFMAHVDNIGYDAAGRARESSDIREILKAWNEFSADPWRPLAANYDRVYVTTGERIRSRWDFKAAAVMTDEGYVPVGSYIEMARETENLQKHMTGIFPYLSISELPHDPFLVSRADIHHVAGGGLQGVKMTARKGDILFARLGPSMGNRKSLLVGDDIDMLYCSNEFHVIRPKEGIPPEYILYLVKSDTFIMQAKAKARGATPSRLRLHADDLPDIMIPRHSVEEMKKRGAHYLQGRIKARDLARESERLIREVSPDF